jgi:hypothetical protein
MKELSAKYFKNISSKFFIITCFGLFQIGSSASNAQFTNSEGWTYGMLASLLVSIIGFICSIIVVALMKIKSLKFEAKLLNQLIVFAAGALFGDVMIHIIPEVFGDHEHDGESSSEATGTRRLLQET